MCGVGGRSRPIFFHLFFVCFCFAANGFFWVLAVWTTPWIGVAHLPLPPADRRPIDPPPIVQLRVIDKARKDLPSPSPSPPPASQHHQQAPSHTHAGSQHTHESSTPLDTSMLTPAGFGGAGPFLQNPYYFMFASLAKPDDDTELHWMKVRCLVLFSTACPLFLPPLFTSSFFLRMARRGVPRDLSSRHSITSRTQKTRTETLASSSFRISACVKRGPIASSLACSK